MSIRLQELKEDYDNIKVPQELKGRVERAISAGKRKNQSDKVQKLEMNSLKIWIFRAVATAAAVVVALTIAVNSSELVANAMGNLPIIGSLAKVVTFRTYEDHSGNMEANIVTPKVEGLENNKGQEKLNEKLTQYTDTIQKQYEQDLKELGSDAHKSISTSYETVANSERFLSIRYQTVIAEGSSDAFTKIYNLDKVSGTILELKDLFKEGADYVTIISKEIIQQMREQMQKQDKNYFIDQQDDLTEQFRSIQPDVDFYLKESGDLIICFDKYEVAPGYMGTPEFIISNTSLQSIYQ